MDEYISRDEAMSLPVLPKEQRIQLDIVDEAFEEGWRQALENLAILPAADVKPVIHAHWYVDDGCAYCSNCRNNFKKAILKAVKFCPMCGAQIDGYGGHPDAGPPTPYDLLYEEGGPDGGI